MSDSRWLVRSRGEARHQAGPRGRGLPMTGGSAHEIRPLRFGVVAPITTDVPAWRDQLRGLADSGFSTVLMPDVPEWQPAPGPALAMAATITGLRVGTWVYASPVRPAWITAWEAHSLSVLTEGRFEMGIGTGRPGIADQLRELGLPLPPEGQRWSQVRDVVAALRELDGPDLHTPVAMAVRGAKAQAVAAELADTVTFVMPQIETRAATTQRVQRFDNCRGAELALHVPVVGDSVAAFMAAPDTDPTAVRAADSLAFLPSDPAAAAEEIQRRREEIGFSYFVFGAGAAGALAPVVAELAGR
ncbi:LLM class flavin-dependent oxidoreductase [Amycolatopsis thermoflava]|uniref:LLM class flavin-dependent oxidoreductase n=1 Tax=Amycolatopsis thermoflava TaxID=84480 RepID=UPI0036564AD3